MSKVETLVQQWLRAGFSLDSKFGPYADLTARDAIPSGERYLTMMVGVLDTDGAGTNGIYYLHNGITNDDWQPVGSGTGSTSTAFYPWEWQDGVDVGGTHLDFVIPTAIDDYEIVDITGCILMVGGSIQKNGEDFTVQSTNFSNDTVRVIGTAAEREPDVEVLLFYNRLGVTQPQPLTHFPQLQDTPADYVGQAERTLKTNSGEDAVEFGFAFWKGTQAEYDALDQSQKDDPNFIQFIIE